EEFEAMVSKIKALIKEDPRVSISIGSFWNDGGITTREAMKKADEEMYRNKKKYYTKHPEYDRRNGI
ncbi:MAG: hypothetical protein J6S49_08915, partial [Erysipelotrichaceae bacterium]|nr:hypothetical protein [Erysipelotrichaceae bacterium]